VAPVITQAGRLDQASILRQVATSCRYLYDPALFMTAAIPCILRIGADTG